MTTGESFLRVQRFPFASFDSEVAALPIVQSPPPAAKSAPVIPPPVPAAPSAPVFSEKDLEAARSEGYAQGHSAGVAEAEAKINKQEKAQAEATHTLLEVIANRITLAAEDQSARRREQRDAAGKLAMIIARKVAGEALKREPYAQIETLLSECMGLVNGEQRILIAVATSRVEGLRQRIDTLRPMLGGFEGQIVVEEDATMGEQDCRVEWKNGYAERSSEGLWKDIEALVTKATL